MIKTLSLALKVSYFLYYSYRKIYEEINPVENGQSKHAMIDSFVGGGPPTGPSLDRAGPIQNQSEFSVPNVKTGKYKSDINREVIH